MFYVYFCGIFVYLCVFVDFETFFSTFQSSLCINNILYKLFINCKSKNGKYLRFCNIRITCNVVHNISHKTQKLYYTILASTKIYKSSGFTT